MFYRTFTFWFTLSAIVICLLNAYGYDRDNVLLYFISIPTWIYELFYDVHRIDVVWIYSSTVISWLLLGFFLDRAIRKRKQQSRTAT